MKKIILVTATALLLVSCGSSPAEQSTETPATSSSTSKSAPTSDTAVSTTTPSSTAQTSAGNTIPGKVGYKHGLGCQESGTCDVNFTIESIENLEACDDVESSLAVPSDTHLVKITALISTLPSEEWNTGWFTISSQWSAVTPDGLNTPLQNSQGCLNQETNPWVGEMTPGDTERRVQYLDVPNGATALRLTDMDTNSRWEFPAA